MNLDKPEVLDRNTSNKLPLQEERSSIEPTGSKVLWSRTVVLDSNATRKSVRLYTKKTIDERQKSLQLLQERRNAEFKKAAAESVESCLDSIKIPTLLQHKSADLTDQIRELLSKTAHEAETRRQLDIVQDHDEVEDVTLDEAVKIELHDD